MSPIRIVFAGTSDFAVPSLQALAADKRFSVELVISQPDRPVGRNQALTPPPVASAAKQLGLPLLQPENINTAMDTLQKAVPQAPDFLVVVAYGQILRDDVLHWPSQLPINVHGSVLPRWRGASPIHHALLMNDATTGVTVQRMVAALDAGPVLSQRAIPIGSSDTFRTLHDRLATLGAELLTQTLAEPLSETPQEEALVTVCRTLKREDGLVDSTKLTAVEIERRIRAFTPWPGVCMNWNDLNLKILEASLTPHAEGWPLTCANQTTLYITSLQPAGKKAMSGKAFASGYSKKT